VVLIAHFTPAEIPGTLAILILGVCLGGLFEARRVISPMTWVVATSLVIFAALGYSGDVRGWSEAVRIAIDVIFLCHAALLASMILRRRT
jgi:hypothetical protein